MFLKYRKLNYNRNKNVVGNMCIFILFVEYGILFYDL